MDTTGTLTYPPKDEQAAPQSDIVKDIIKIAQQVQEGVNPDHFAVVFTAVIKEKYGRD